MTDRFWTEWICTSTILESWCLVTTIVKLQNYLIVPNAEGPCCNKGRRKDYDEL